MLSWLTVVHTCPSEKCPSLGWGISRLQLWACKHGLWRAQLGFVSWCDVGASGVSSGPSTHTCMLSHRELPPLGTSADVLDTFLPELGLKVHFWVLCKPVWVKARLWLLLNFLVDSLIWGISQSSEFHFNAVFPVVIFSGSTAPLLILPKNILNYI